MDVVVPLLAFLLGAVTHRCWNRFWQDFARDIATRAAESFTVERCVELRVLDLDVVARRFRDVDVQREIERLIEETRS